MISNRPMIPMLTHVDNLGDLNLDMTTQENLLQSIESDTDRIRSFAGITNDNVKYTLIEAQTIHKNSTDIKNAIGTTGDTDTATTVIGLLKSIVNKLS